MPDADFATHVLYVCVDLYGVKTGKESHYDLLPLNPGGFWLREHLDACKRQVSMIPLPIK